MFKGYRMLLTIVCDKEWYTDFKKTQFEKFIYEITDTTVESKILIDLIKNLSDTAFQTKDQDLFFLCINTLMSLDAALEKKMEESKEGDSIIENGTNSRKGVISYGGLQEAGDEILDKKYDIKKHTLEYVLENIGEERFCLNDVQSKLEEYYHTILKKKTKDGSLKMYSNRYLNYMIEHNFVIQDKQDGYVSHSRSKKMYQLVEKKDGEEKTQEKVKKSNLIKVAQYILHWAEKNGTDLVDITLMGKHRLKQGENYQRKDLYKGFDELVFHGIAKRLDKTKWGLNQKRIV